MTLRQLIENGADLDDKIHIEVTVVDEAGDWLASYYSFGGVSIKDAVFEDGNITIKAIVEDVN